MKRKIIKQGHNTLTITIPNKWAKSLNLQAGNEIDVNEHNNGLFLTTEKQNRQKTTTIDISGMTIPTIWKYFMAVYREGFDEIKVVFDPEEKFESPFKFYTIHTVDEKYHKEGKKNNPLETIQLFTSRFIGFEIIEQHKDYCVIKDMADPTSKEFDNSLRRVFLLIQQMAEEMLEAIRTNNYEMVEHTHDIDINVDKFHDYCVRVLNKTNTKDVQKTHILFSTLILLEMVGDEFKHIARHILRDMGSTSMENLLPLAEMMTDQFNKFYSLFYSFDTKKISELSEQDMKIHSILPRIYKKKGKKSELTDSELEVFNHFRRTTAFLNALTELRIEMEF